MTPPLRAPCDNPPMTSVPVFLSSGDLIADRRYRWAIDRLDLDDLEGAADVLAQALELAPGFASAWFALGVTRDRRGDRDGAIAAFAAARDADPEDYHGARLQLARLGAEAAAPDMSVYVRRLFDQHAPEFEEALRNRLSYSGPEQICAAVTSRRRHFVSMLDLGCGTGLAGVTFRSCVDQLTGVDISDGMVAQARTKRIYDRLVVSELEAFMLSEAAASFELIVAADVFVYLGDLTPIAAAAARVLAPDGLLAFTVETHSGNNVALQPTLRFAHGEHHVRGALAAAGLQTVTLTSVSTRTEKGEPVPGLLAIAAPTEKTRSL
jgi:predicted TPR repeat methyltransferase